MDHLRRNRRRMGHSINKTHANAHQNNRQSPTHGGQTNTGPPQLQSLALPLPRIGLADMELKNSNVTNETIPPPTLLHKPNNSSNTEGRQELTRRWVTAAELQLSAAFPEGPPITPLEWQQHLQQWEIAQKQADAEELLYNSRRHPNLAHYSPYIAAQPSNPCINRMIHHHSINDANAITISRLLCGGQGLNAGDPIRPTEVCMRKACKFCLSLGQPKAETLWHFLHQCPLTAMARQSSEAKECWGQPEKIVQLHLSVWTYKQLRVIRGTMVRMWQLRQAFNRDQAKAQSFPE